MNFVETAMGDHSGQAAGKHQDQHRSTSQGRLHGSVSYAADEQAAAEDLRRRPSASVPAQPVAEHWSERPSRTTGARRRVG